jgi:hypothetical protein
MGDNASIIATAVTVLGTAGIWKFLEARLRVKAEEKKNKVENSDGVQYRDDLKNRVRNLEALLAQSAQEKDDLRDLVLKLTEEVSALRIKVEYLEKENDRLKNK